MAANEDTTRWVPFYEAIVSPDYAGWDAPAAPVVAWVAIHFAVNALLVAVLAAGAMTHGVWLLPIGLVWIAATSGLVIRIGRHLLVAATTPVGVESVAYPARSMSVSLKAGGFLVLSQMAYLAVRETGLQGVIVFAGVVTLSVGIRIAGLDAWAGVTRERLFYIRAVLSWKGLFNVALTAGSAAFAFWLPTLLLGSLATTDEPIWILPADMSWSARFGEFAIILALLTLPTLMVCEAIGLAARYDERLTTLIVKQERQLQQARIAGAIHDSALYSARRLQSPCSEAEHRSVAIRLETDLRRLQRETEPDVASERPVRGCLARSLERANQVGLELIPDISRAVLVTVLKKSAADLLEALTRELVTNSANAEATSAELGLRVEGSMLQLRYVDDGGGYDPTLALERDGGLSRLVRRTQASGGHFEFDVGVGKTASIVGIPIETTPSGDGRA